MSETSLLEGTGAQPSWAMMQNHRERFAEQHCYALVDGALNEKLLGQVKRRWPWLEWYSLYEDLPESAWPESTPLFFHVGVDEGERFVRWLLTSQQVAAESVLFVWAAASTEAMAKHLGQYAELKTAAGTRAVLRFHDPNIWPAALAVMTQDSVAHFLAPVFEVWFPDVDNVWHITRGAGKDVPQPIKEYVWTQEQEERFAELILPRKILRSLEIDNEERLTGRRGGWLETLQGWIKRAKKAGAKNAGEMTLYCVVALQVGGGFEADESVATELNGISTRHLSFSQAISNVSPETWNRLSRLHETGGRV